MIDQQHYNFAFLDEGSKKEIRRTILKAVCIPGYQVAFGSREMPIARGWGTGGLQITLSLAGPEDVLKVIDQGNDDSVNALNIKKLVCNATGIETTIDTKKATLIQSRHRIPEETLTNEQILVLQVPNPEPLRGVERREEGTRRMHAEKDYSGAWLRLYDSMIRFGHINVGAGYPVMIEDRYIMTPSPIPRWDNHLMNNAPQLTLLGAGREKKIFAVPPYTKCWSLQFDDVPFEKEDFHGHACRHCGATDTFMNEIEDDATGQRFYECSDTSYCIKRRQGGEAHGTACS